MKTFYYLYQITNKTTGKIYVGVHKTKNLDDGYMGSGKYLKHAIRKYGIESFHKEILEYFDNMDDMFTKEAVIVDTDFVLNENTYNTTTGGRGGFDNKSGGGFEGRHHSKETRLLKSQIQKNNEKNMTDEQHQARTKKIKQSLKDIGHNHATFAGYNHTDEAKQKIGIKNSVHQTGSGNSQYGKCWIYSLTLKKSKSIYKDELDDYLNQGWIKGRKYTF